MTTLEIWVRIVGGYVLGIALGAIVVGLFEFTMLALEAFRRVRKAVWV